MDMTEEISANSIMNWYEITDSIAFGPTLYALSRQWIAESTNHSNRSHSPPSLWVGSRFIFI